MKFKICILAICLITSMTLDVLARSVSEIVIEGNEIVSEKEIRRKISLRVGDEYSSVAAGKDIGAIYDIGKFDDVSLLLDELPENKVRVIFRVRERPVIHKIEFKGNNEIKSSTLLKKIELKKGEFFDEFLMEEDSDKIKEYYLEKGFADCSIELYTTEVEGENRVIITYYVSEGNKIKVEKINLVGVVKEERKKVLKELKTKESKVFKQGQLDEDIKSIRTFYKNNGYLNVDVSPPLITYDPDRKNVYITVFVFENSKYNIGRITFVGNTKIDEAVLSEAIRIKKGQLYSEEKVKIAQAAIQEEYGREGHIRAGIIPHYIPGEEKNEIDIKFEIHEGPKVYIRNIFLDGNYITRDYVIKREFKVKGGDPFNLEKVRKSQAEIFKTGFFSNVQIDILPAGVPDKTDLVFMVEEQKTGMASVGAGYSSEDRLVGTVKISQDNLLGRGQKLSLMWEFGARKQNYSISFTEPWLFNTPTPFSASIYNTVHRRFLGAGNYSEQRAGGSLSLGRHFTDELSSSLKYSLEQVRIYDIHTAIKDDISESLDTTSSITPISSFDTRDYPFDPSRGYLIRASNQIAGGIFGGDSNFVKFECQKTYFQPIFWKFVAVGNVKGGAVSGFGDTVEVPIYERFNVGGAESIRGYDYRDRVFPTKGGRYKLIGNMEIKFPIVSEKGMTLLQGAVFYDIGSTWNNFSDITLRSGIGENKLKRGFGVGIRIKIRAFPIRLDWGFAVDKHPKESQWYFTMGDIF